MDYLDLFAALGLALVLEGAAYALFPDAMRKMMEQIIALPVTNIRTIGLFAAFAGFALVWLVKS
ncbi:MAG: ubiquitin-binding protein [Magnetovibrio sp.]|nr:ubiquitin-binding protein [Magnetovibrio sp.]|tara:strand:+ start:39 stop:230 length:192 start_codon:yes stop_codon:yes gene_type:complete